VSYRRIATVTAVLAASAALVPALAFASDSSSSQPTARGSSLSASSLTAAFKTFTSSGSKSAYTSKSATHAAAAAAAAAAESLTITAVATSAYGISLTADLTGGTAASASVDWGDSSTSSGSVTTSTEATADHTYEQLGTYTVTVTVTDSLGDTVVNTVTVTTAGSDYTAYGPTRVLDTRYGTGAPKAPVKPRSITQVTFAGNGGIPKDVTAVVLNVTVTEPTAAGDIIVYGDGTPRPSSSNVNFVKGQTVPNQVIAPVGVDGKVDFYNASTGSTDLIADVAGYFTQTPSSGYSSLTPYRLVDTRVGTGEPKRPLAGKSSFAVQIAGNDGGKLPASGITAVALNITSTASQGSGFLTAYADGTNTPTASNVNFTANQTIANSVITPVGSDGKIRIFNGSTKATGVVVDVVGYYSAASVSAYVPVDPFRLFDTRTPGTDVSGPLPGGDYIYSALSAGYPDYTGFVLNTTVTEPTSGGDLIVSPDSNTLAQYQSTPPTAVSPSHPSASTLNWTKGETVPNLVQASTGANGIVDFWNASSGSIALVVDVFGFYQND
jgi:PKD repeat protein